MKWKSYEAKWQKKWEKQGVFVPSLDSKKKFFLTIPYPYTSGALHIGHGRTFTLGDIIARFKRHQGYTVLFPMAFHISGSPILSISDKIAKEDVRTIRLYLEYLRIYETPENAEKIITTFTDPKKVAKYFAGKISQDFKSIGYSIDWTREFNTGEERYNKFVEWQYHQLKEKGVLVQGKYPILWSLEVGQPVGEDDIADGDTDKVTITEFNMIKFPFDGEFLVAASLRPETIFGTTNLWVNPKGIYVRTKVDGETWLISREAAEKLRVQGHEVDVSKDFRGREIVGRFAQNPLTGEKLPVLPAHFVDLDNGTGVVYAVPAHAPYDYQALCDLSNHERLGNLVDINQLPVIINIPGYSVPAKEVNELHGIKDQKDSRLEAITKELYKTEFYSGLLNNKCGKFSGLRVSEAKDKVRDKLRKDKVSSTLYETSRKAITRSKNKVVVSVIDDQWFIDYSNKEWKKKGTKWIKRMEIIPEKYRKWFLDTIEWLDKRPCARKRGLGTKFPFDKDWIIEPLSDSTIYMAFYTIAKYLKDLSPDSMKLELFDFVFLGTGSLESVVKTTGIKRDTIETMRKEFLEWYPNDLRHTAPAHVSNHLTFFIMHHIAIFDPKYWPKGISLNEVLIREGVKMSKSKGNVITLAHVAEKYGSDLYRLYVASSAELDAVIDWRERDVQGVSSKLSKFIDIIEKGAKAEEGELELVDEWFLSKFYISLKSATKHMEDLKFRDAIVDLMFKTLNDFKWLERRSKNPFGTVKRILKTWLIALAPVIPHTAEEYWPTLGGEGFASLAPWPSISEKPNISAVTKEEFVRSVLNQVRDISKLADKKPTRVFLYIADKWKYRALEAVIKEKERAMKSVGQFENKEAASKVIQSLIKGRIWEKFSEAVDEEATLKDAIKALEEELGAKVEINSKRDPLKKKDRAMPFRPAIYLE
ncbi:MAG: leucine--tRNA ligase [Candidatus Altiarchaeota archaeon]|nr:leucine--tRNA ligase [Candidatus Altiarchaeota archaeon]